MFHYDSKINLSLINQLIKLFKEKLKDHPDLIRAKLLANDSGFFLIIKNNTRKTKAVLSFQSKNPNSFKAVCYERIANTAFNITKDFVERETIIFPNNPTALFLYEKLIGNVLIDSQYMEHIRSGAKPKIELRGKINELNENTVYAGLVTKSVIDTKTNSFKLICANVLTQELKDFDLSNKDIPHIKKHIANKTLDKQYLVVNSRMEYALFNKITFSQYFALVDV